MDRLRLRVYRLRLRVYSKVPRRVLAGGFASEGQGERSCSIQAEGEDGREGGPGRGGPQTVLWWGHGMNDFLSRPAREPLSISLLFCASWLVDG